RKLDAVDCSGRLVTVKYELMSAARMSRYCGTGGPVVSLLVRFGLPLALTVGCLAIARMEIHPYSSWASPAGQRLLAENEVPVAGADRDVLAAIAVRGVRAVDDPALRAALGGGPGGPLR
ncbi:hypothetical protein ABZ355_42280, partial [Streptomyces sp. NPDC005989]